jgi:hypothetical protein
MLMHCDGEDVLNAPYALNAGFVMKKGYMPWSSRHHTLPSGNRINQQQQQQHSLRQKCDIQHEPIFAAGEIQKSKKVINIVQTVAETQACCTCDAVASLNGGKLPYI